MIADFGFRISDRKIANKSANHSSDFLCSFAYSSKIFLIYILFIKRIIKLCPDLSCRSFCIS